MREKKVQPFVLLPQECWEHVFAFFTVSELCNAANCCQHARFASESPVLWQNVLAHRFGLYCSVHTVYRRALGPGNAPPPPARQYWKQLYRRRTQGVVEVCVRTLAGTVLGVTVRDGDTRLGLFGRVRAAQRAAEGCDWPPVFDLIDTISGAKPGRTAAGPVLVQLGEAEARNVEQTEQPEQPGGVEHWERRHSTTNAAAEHVDVASANAVAEVTDLLQLGVASMAAAAVPAGYGYPYLRATATGTATAGGPATAAPERLTGPNTFGVGENSVGGAVQAEDGGNASRRHVPMVLDGAIFEQVLVSSCTQAGLSAPLPSSSPLPGSPAPASTSAVALPLPVTAHPFPAAALPPRDARPARSSHWKRVCDLTSSPAKLIHALQDGAVHGLLTIAMGGSCDKGQTRAHPRLGNAGDEYLHVPSAAGLELDNRIDAAKALELFLCRAQALMSAMTGAGVWKLARPHKAQPPQLHPLLCIAAGSGPAPPLPLRHRAEAAVAWAQLTLAAAFAAPAAADWPHPARHRLRGRHRWQRRWLRGLRGVQSFVARWLVRLPWAIRRGFARATLRWGAPAMLPWLLVKGWPIVAVARLRTARQRSSAIGNAVYDSGLYGAGVSATRAVVAATVVIVLHAADGWDETRLWWGLIAVAVRVSVPHVVLGVWYELALATIRNAWRREGVAQRLLALGAAAAATATTAAAARRARTFAAALGLVRGVPVRARVAPQPRLQRSLPWIGQLRIRSRWVTETLFSAMAWKLGECFWSIAACTDARRILPTVGRRAPQMRWKGWCWWRGWRECATCGRDAGSCSCSWSLDWLTARRLYLPTSSYGVPIVAFWSLARLRLLLAA